jgi:uncharacterized Fe-S cluster-containing radical SAM superfamily protein
MTSGKGDGEKVPYWRKTMGKVARSGMSVGGVRRRRRLRENHFYWGGATSSSVGSKAYCAGREFLRAASFALMSEEAGARHSGIELALVDGR